LYFFDWKNKAVMVGFSSCCKEVEASKGVMLNGEIPMRLSEAVTIGID